MVFQPIQYGSVADHLLFTFCRKGNLKEAETVLKEALEVTKKARGEEHPDVATRLNNLAFVLKDQGNAKEAARMGKRALAIWEKALGPDHPDTQDAQRMWG